MTQREAYKLLRKFRGHAFTSKQIAKKLKITVTSAANNLNKLVRDNLARRIPDHRNWNSFVYKSK